MSYVNGAIIVWNIPWTGLDRVFTLDKAEAAGNDENVLILFVH